MCARIVHIASEIAPIAKVGGLADVVAGLSHELASEGHSITVIIPRYSIIDFSEIVPQGQIDRFQFMYEDTQESAYVEYFSFGKISLCLLDTERDSWHTRPKIYGSIEEDTNCFIRFALASASWLCSNTFIASPPSVLHLHDWQAAFISALFLPEGCLSFPYKRPKIVLTLHNLEYQGRCPYAELARAGYSVEKSFFYEAASDPSGHGANLLKLGIFASDAITTVSPTYAKEISEGESDRGLKKALINKGSAFSGILNGVDYAYWNPALDRFLPMQYDYCQDIVSIRNAKKMAQKRLWDLLDISFSEEIEKKPFFGVVVRLVEQKGLHLLESILEQVESLDVRCVFLGTAYDQKVSDRFQDFNRILREKKRGAVLLKNSEEVAHLIFAASDMFLVPSLFEPCGLTQIIAMRYGSIPIVRMTGGLADTVVDVDYPVPSRYVEGENGFVFCHPDRMGIQSAVGRALRCFRDEPDRWNSYVANALMQNFSWKASTEQYLKVYEIDTE